MRKYSEFFVDLAAQMHEMRRFPPSVVALACILCARKVNNVSPVWSSCLQELTSYEYEHAFPAFTLL